MRRSGLICLARSSRTGLDMSHILFMVEILLLKIGGAVQQECRAALPICRLHFHAVHFMRTLPTGSVDPNFGRRVRNRRQLNSLQNTWPYGYSMPIAVR